MCRPFRRAFTAVKIRLHFSHFVTHSIISIVLISKLIANCPFDNAIFFELDEMLLLRKWGVDVLSQFSDY